METALTIGGWIMICATALPLSRSDAWWVRIFDFPRLQLTLCFIAIFAMYVFVREDPSTADNIFLGLLALCLAYQIGRMYPYTPLARVQVERGSGERSMFCSKQFRVLAFKVLRDCGSDHFPVFARLSLEASATDTSREPTASPHDQARAHAKIDAAKSSSVH